jgi:hypothetical protein
MKAFVSKTIIAGAIAAMSLFGAAGAQAATTFNQFEVQPTVASGEDNFVADKIVGGYVEKITFNTDGTFNSTLLWNASAFFTIDPVNGNATQVNDTGLNNTSGYQLYALYKASGTYSTSGNKASFTFTPGSGSLEVYLDPNYGTGKTHPDRTVFVSAPATGGGDWVLSNNTDDIKIAYGTPILGFGNLDPSLSTCSSGTGAGINCGSFGAESSLTLTDAGKSFFVTPNTFYGATYQSGQLNNFQVGGTTTINGSLDVVFIPQPIPEPASLGLLGLGLLGLGVLRRRKQS